MMASDTNRRRVLQFLGLTGAASIGTAVNVEDVLSKEGAFIIPNDWDFRGAGEALIKLGQAIRDGEVYKSG